MSQEVAQFDDNYFCDESSGFIVQKQVSRWEFEADKYSSLGEKYLF